MKNLFVLIISILSFNITLNAQCQSMVNQFNEFEMTMTDKKGKASFVNTYKVKARNGNAVTFDVMMKDIKGKEMINQDMIIECDGENVKMDISNFTFNNSTETLGNIDMEMEIENTDLEFPNNLSVGQTLPDAETNVKTAGMTISSMKITDRKVVAKETLKTSAGSFECFKVTCVNQSKTGFIKTKNDQTQWYCPDMGFVIKHETYSRDKLVSSCEITALK